MGRVRAFVVTTVCKSVDEFIERYHSRVEGRSIFVSVIEERAIGSECAFAITLADRQHVLAGICEIIEVFRDAKNEFGRRGMRLGISRLGLDSQRVWAELAARGDRRFPRGTSALPLDEEYLVDLSEDAIPVMIEDDSPPDSVEPPRAATAER